MEVGLDLLPNAARVRGGGLCVRAWVIIALFNSQKNHKKEADFHCIPRFLPLNNAGDFGQN